MFTGIVEIIGEVSKLEEIDPTSGGGTTLTISGAEEILGDCHEGDSISVNGTCLTVTSFTSSSFKVGIAPETLRRTNLGTLRAGSHVNLERAVSAATRMGGHFVQGHVDTVATIARVVPDGEALTFRFMPRDPAVLRYVVEKGFVTIDGASLTVTAVRDASPAAAAASAATAAASGETAGQDEDAQGWWEVMLIAYTQDRVVTAGKRAGEQVNVEVDMVGKYVEKNVTAWFEEKLAGTGQQQDTVPALDKLIAKLVDERLKTHGVLP